jgi:hypothetical protein
MDLLFWVLFLLANVAVGLVVAVVPGVLKGVIGLLWTLIFVSVLSDFLFDTPLIAISNSNALVTLLGPISLVEIGLVVFLVLVAVGGLIEG